MDKTEYKLKHYDDLDVMLLRNAAHRYFKASPSGRPDLQVWKDIELDFLNKQKPYLWRCFTDFYFTERLYQLRDWIPDLSKGKGA